MSKRFTQADVDAFNARKATTQPVPVEGKKVGKGKPPSKPAKTYSGKEKAHILRTLEHSGVPFVTELRFAQPRRFKFDYAIPEMKVAIEYEGIYSGKSRHTSMKGYTMDACKYNIAAANGWRVFRYTSGNYMDIVTDLQKLGITIKEV